MNLTQFFKPNWQKVIITLILYLILLIAFSAVESYMSGNSFALADSLSDFFTAFARDYCTEVGDGSIECSSKTDYGQVLIMSGILIVSYLIGCVISLFIIPHKPAH